MKCSFESLMKTKTKQKNNTKSPKLKVHCILVKENNKTVHNKGIGT